MFEYEIQRMNHAELVREAAAQRLVREAADAAGAGRGLRLFGHRFGGHAAEERTADGGRGRFVRAA
ncbi:hypothetical protein ABZ318_15245 [Streptomyces sp. NPDC006197]|uniref:hypothetical protein n=1 Tax=Streptomyces sp. NPDC006197 TaxID=3156685 RepID=UPI0033A50F9B